MITFDDFKKLELRTGKILEVNEHSNADKLYVLKVNIGEKEIQLVAGIKAYYSPDELKGKTVVVIANLEPRAVRGVESQGMLLAAQGEGKVVILTTEKEISSGSVVR
ncbi:MAG: hypothetical protein ABH872_02405 [Candidatus Omnitrophota bacterium]